MKWPNVINNENGTILLITMIILVGVASLHAAGIPIASLADFITGTFQGLASALSGDLADRN